MTMITDHESLKYMNTIQTPSKGLTRWMNEFQQYDLIIKYHSEKQTIISDVINRCSDYIPYIHQFLQDQ